MRNLNLKNKKALILTLDLIFFIMFFGSIIFLIINNFSVTDKKTSTLNYINYDEVNSITNDLIKISIQKDYLQNFVETANSSDLTNLYSNLIPNYYCYNLTIFLKNKSIYNTSITNCLDSAFIFKKDGFFIKDLNLYLVELKINKN